MATPKCKAGGRPTKMTITARQFRLVKSIIADGTKLNAYDKNSEKLFSSSIHTPEGAKLMQMFAKKIPLKVKDVIVKFR